MDSNTIYGMFRDVVGRWPDRPAVIEETAAVEDAAVIDATKTYTFAELDALANRIMTKFYDQRPQRVGIVMSHGARQMAAILGVLKSGAAYVPAEPALPRDRRDYMMHAAEVSLIIDDDYCRDLPVEVPDLPDRSKPNALAYILFTSGTSGKPKGVMVENHSVANYARAFENEFRIGPGDIMLQYSVCSFDIFVEEVFASLLNGVAVAVAPSDITRGPIGGLMQFVERHGITIVDGFPYLLAEMNHLPVIPASVKLIISGGDVIRGSYIANLRDKGVKIYNTYGPSETTVCSNYYRVDNVTVLNDGTFPIGRPIQGVEVKIMDTGLHEVADGEIGEICIMGEGVSRGYTGNPPEQSNFVTLADGRRLYRSGDLGYVLPDGNMAFTHRRDDQVMILGRRVEPEEVENVLNTFPGIERGVVRAFRDDSGLYYLTAYIVPRGDCRLSDVRQWLASKLADFMVPEYFVRMQHIPITPRGKVDTKALPVVMKEGEGF